MLAQSSDDNFSRLSSHIATESRERLAVDIFQGQERKLENISAELFSEYFAVSTGVVSYELGIAFYNELQALDTEFGDTEASDLFLDMNPQAQIQTLRAYEAGIGGEQREAPSWLVDNLTYLNHEIEILVAFTSTGERIGGISIDNITSTHPTLTLAGIIENFPSVIQVITPEIQGRIRALEKDIIPSMERRLEAERARTEAERARTAEREEILNAERARTEAERTRTQKIQLANQIADLYR